MILAHNAVRLGTKTDYDVSEHTIIHIKATLPEDLSRIDSQCISLLNVVIQKRC